MGTDTETPTRAPTAAPTPTPGLQIAATYERTVGASLERVWENVLDWEHLPWLHARAFDEIEKVDAGTWGWRARLTGAGGGESRVALLIDREAGRYVARTGEPPGPVSEIWTELEAASEASTRVRVAFHVPEMPDDSRDAVGRIYVDVYRGLWDEDEEMMRERAERLTERDSPPTDTPVDLGPAAELRARLPHDVVFGGERFRVIDREGELVAHAAVCPHMLGPLFEADGDTDTLECPWHGYAFDASTGRSCDGRALRLPPPPRVEIDATSGRCRLVGPG